jgi:hypothetical protein
MPHESPLNASEPRIVSGLMPTVLPMMSVSTTVVEERVTKILADRLGPADSPME